MRATGSCVLALIAGLAIAAPPVQTAAPQAQTPLYQRFLSNPNPGLVIQWQSAIRSTQSAIS